MKFIKVGNNYMIKNSNGRIVSEQEKLELENKELIIKDIQSNECQGKTTQKIIKNKKRLKTLEALKEVSPLITDVKFSDKKLNKETKPKITALKKKEVGADDIIKETDKSI